MLVVYLMLLSHRYEPRVEFTEGRLIVARS